MPPLPVEAFTALIRHLDCPSILVPRIYLIHAAYSALGFAIEDRLHQESMIGSPYPEMMAGSPSITGPQLARALANYCMSHGCRIELPSLGGLPPPEVHPAPEPVPASLPDTDPYPPAQTEFAGQDRNLCATDSGAGKDIPGHAPAPAPAATPAQAQQPAVPSPQKIMFPMWLIPALQEQLRLFLARHR